MPKEKNTRLYSLNKLDMKKFYFTYGTSKCYPFRGGWTLIFAPNKSAAAQIFKAYHPNPNDKDVLNCCDYYDAEYFEKSSMYRDGNCGAFCHEIIGVARLEPMEVKT